MSPEFHTHEHMCIITCVQVCTCSHDICIYICVYTCVCTCVYVHMCMYGTHYMYVAIYRTAQKCNE